VLERRGEEVSLHVMDSEEWNIARERQRFPEAHTNQQGADEARRIRDGDGADVVGAVVSASSIGALYHGTMLVRCAREAFSNSPPNTRWTSCDRITRDFWVMSSPPLQNSGGGLRRKNVSMRECASRLVGRSISSRSTERARLGRFQSVADISSF